MERFEAASTLKQLYFETIIYTALYDASVTDMVSTTKLNLAKPKLRLGLSRRQRCKPLHPYYRAGTQ